MKSNQKFLICESSFDFFERIAIPAESILEIQTFQGKGKNQALWQNNPIPVLEISDPGISLAILIKTSDRILGFPVKKTFGFKSALSLKPFNDPNFKLLATFDNEESIPVLNVNSLTKPASLSKSAKESRGTIICLLEDLQLQRIVQRAFLDFNWQIKIFSKTEDLLPILEEKFNEAKKTGLGLANIVPCILTDINPNDHPLWHREITTNPKFNRVPVKAIQGSQNPEIQIAHLVEKLSTGIFAALNS
jgi:hypothetical protein